MEWIVLPANEIEKLMKPCSRDFPSALSGRWTPTSDDVARAEQKIGAAIQTALAKVPPEYRKNVPAAYYRQYTGFMRNARKVLYVNGFDQKYGADTPWRSRTVSICDGGLANFGAVFDLSTEHYDSFAFSGTYAGFIPGGGQ
jgi:hypothetical protein